MQRSAERISISNRARTMMFFPRRRVPSDNLAGAVGVSCAYEHANFQNVREPGLTLSIQLAEDALAA
jgi:hypothetical protein